MSGARAALPRAAWVAAGAAGTAGAALLGAPVAILPVAAAVLLGAAALAAGRPVARERLVAGGVGVLALALRIVATPAPGLPPPLPADRGPWAAVVESVGSPKDGGQLARLRLTTVGGEVTVAATLPAFPEVAAGERVEVAGRLRPPPDDDGYGAYLRRTGASGSLAATSLRAVAPGSPRSLQAMRDGAGDALRLALPEPEAGLAAGILIGLRERVDRDLAADFATAGASHVVAISGWNIAIVAGIVGAALRGRSRRLVAMVVGGTIVAYVVAAGASPSVVRAAVMASVVLVARESGRAGRAPAALAWAVTLLLVADPRMIGDAGFRLSVLATAGLLAWATPLGRWLGARSGGRLPGWLAESLGISLAAQAATLPDVLATFGRLSLVAPAVNLAVVPLVPIAMAGGVAALVGGAATALGAPAWVATLAGLPGWLVLHVIVAIVRLAASLPLASIALPPGLGPPAAAAALGAIAAALVALRRLTGVRRARPPSAPPGRPSRTGRRTRAHGPVRRLLLVGVAIAIGIAGTAAVQAATRATRLTVLDVGQGDAILVESRTGARMLVDGGPDPDRLLIALDERIPPWDRRLDVVVLTHPHEDHVAGLARVLERYAVGRVYEPGMRGPGPGWLAWDRRLHDGPPRGLLATGAHIRLGEVSLTVLWPDPGSVPLVPADGGTAINNVSIVFLGEANGRRFLLMGDVEQGIDPQLLSRGLPRVDVLKVAHHGSGTASTEAFLEAVAPRVAVVSAGTGNPYGHPAPATIGRLRGTGARVFRTDLDGSVSIELRDDGVVARATGGRSAATDVPLVEVPVARAAAAGFLCGIPPRAIGGAATVRVPATALAPDRRAVTTAAALPLGYDRGHDRPGAPRGRPTAPLPRPARLAPAALVRRRGHRRLAGAPGRGVRAPGRRRARRGGGAAPRRRQGAAGTGPGPPAPARRGIRGLARHARAP